MTTTRTNLFDLQASRARFVRRCASNALHLLDQIDRADDADVAALVCGALAELRQAEDELAWHDIAPAATA